MTRVIIVGAGFYGLIAAKTYLQVTGAYDGANRSDSDIYIEELPTCFTMSGTHAEESDPALLIVDAASGLGGTWMTDRLYPNLLSQNSYGAYEYSDLPLSSVMPAGKPGKESNQFITGSQINQYLHAWSRKWDLIKHMRFNWKVMSISRLPTRDWKLEIQITSGASSQSITATCDKLILATGLTSEPNIPVIPCVDGSTTVPPGIHAKEVGLYCQDNLGYRPFRNDCRLGIIEPRKPFRCVAVYGGAKSSFDFVHLFASMHRNTDDFQLDYTPTQPLQVHWIIRDQGAGAAWIAPPKSKLPSGEVTETDKTASTRLSGKLNICAYPTPKRVVLVRQSPAWKWGLRVEGSWLYTAFHGNPLGRLVTRRDREATNQGLAAYAGYESSPKMRLLRPSNGTIECTSAVGIANHSDLWDTIRGSNVHIHRSSIATYSGGDSNTTLHLADGTEIPSVDLVVHATGWRPVVPIQFEPPRLGVSLGLACSAHGPPPSDHVSKDTLEGVIDWEDSDKEAERRMRKYLHHSRTHHGEKPEFTPYRLYRRMVAPSLVAEGDRSTVALGILLTNNVAIVAEVQALWAAAFLTGKLDHGRQRPRGSKSSLSLNMLSQREMEASVSEDVVWGRLTGSNLFVDALQYNDMLMRDLGLNPNRMGGGFWKELTSVYGPSAYAGIVDEWLGR